jgi:hypothetical protein
MRPYLIVAVILTLYFVCFNVVVFLIREAFFWLEYQEFAVPNADSLATTGVLQGFILFFLIIGAWVNISKNQSKAGQSTPSNQTDKIASS